MTPANNNASLPAADAHPIAKPATPMELAQLADAMEKLAQTNRTLVWEAEKLNAERRTDQRELRHLRGEVERLEKENTRLARLAIEQTEAVGHLRNRIAELEMRE
jgi:predicted nuclease with TOPRIM domain